MRTFVAIVLILCGTLLASAPFASDLGQAIVVGQALAEPRAPGASYFFRQPLDESYRLGGWILGGAMICLGIIGGSGHRNTVQHCPNRAGHLLTHEAT